MAKALRTIAVVAGAVALIATGVGAIGGAGFAATALGGTIASVATWAGVVAGIAGIGARLLTKPPPARGSVTETIIDIDPPSPYGMGEGYFGGVMRHRVGYGPTLKKVPNPFLFEVLALSVAGPIAGPITPQVDFGAVTSYYSGWLATDTRLGARPDTALTAPLQASPPGWSTAHKLSGTAAIAWNHKFDKDGKIYASGLPTRGVVAKWVLVYDPRKDSTRPGGSGAHRLGDETTYEWSENPALHAGTYAFGRYINDKRVIGVGLPDEGIDWEGIAAWANDCDANGWRMFGFVFEGAQDDAQRRWQNLRDICIAGGGEPLFSGAVLGFHWNRPRIALDTVTEADLADGPQEVTAMQSWRDRLNTLRPRYISPLHNWSMVQADQVQIESYVTEDGQERAEDIPFNFVKDVDQAAELAAYWLVNSRELTPITLTLMPRLRGYRPGECLRLELPELGLDHDAVILRRQFDPGSMTVTLTLVTEDPDKHAFALGRTGVAPPTPALTNSAEDRDTITREARAPYWPDVDGPGRPADDATRNVPMGTYDAGTTYQRGDNVIFSGSTYQLIVDESTGNDPPDALRWALVASAGSGTPGADGLEGLTIIVSNEAHTVATAADGTGGTFTSAGGQMSLRRGATVLTPTFGIAATSPATGWISIDSSTGVYTVTDPGVNFATATLRATWAGVNYDRTYTLAKARAGLPGVDGVDGADGADGVDGLVGFLTNEAHTVAVAAGGTFSLAGSNGVFRVFSGATDVTASATFSIVGGTDDGSVWTQTKNGLRLSINEGSPNPGPYSLSVVGAWTSAAETFTLRATYAGATIDRIYSISKAVSGADGVDGLDGTDGANAKTLTVLSDRQTIAYDASGLPTPTTQTTTFSTNKQNTTATVNWTITDAAGVARTPVTSFLSSATGNSVTMTEAQFAAARNGTSGVIVTGTISDGTTFSDKISVVRVQEGQTGAQGPEGETAGVISLYIRAPEGSTPAKPTSTSMVYTVGTNTITNAGSWSTAIPAANGLPLWRIDRPFLTSAATITVTGASFGIQTIVNRDGVSATTGLLTNEAHTVAAASDGTGYSLSGAGGNFEVFFGGANVRLSSTFSIVGSATKNGLTLSLAANGVYTLSGAAWTTDTETFTLRAVYQGVTLDQTYTISKSKAGAGGAAGAAGANAKLINLSATRQQVRFNSAGALDPTSQDTVFTVARQNTAIAATFTIFDLAGTAVSSALLTGTGDSRTLTAANFNTARGLTQGVRVVATVSDGGTLTDQITVVRVADGVDSNQVRISTTHETFPFIAHTGQPVAQTANLAANLTAISGTVTWRLKAEGSETLIAPTSAWMTVSSAPSLTATITQAQFAQFLVDYPGTTMRVVATVGSFSDERVLTRVADATTTPTGGSFIRTRNGDVSVGGWIGAARSTTVPAGTTRPGARSLQLATNSRERPAISRVIRPGDSFRLRYPIRTIGSGTACGNIFFALYDDTGNPLTTSSSFANLPIHAPNVLDWTYVDQVITYVGTTEIINWCPGFDSVNATLGNINVDNFDMDFAPVNPVAAANSNLVRFSRMENGQGWSTPFSTIPITTATRPVSFGGREFIRTDGAPTASGQQMYVGVNSANHFVANAGERFSVSAAIEAIALTGPAPSFWQLYVDFFNSAGTNVGSATIATGSGNKTSTDRVAGFGTAPANAVKAALMLRVDSGGAGTLYSSLEGPMVTRAAIGQTDHPAYVPGPNSDDGADVTATAQRAIDPQFPVIEIKQGEAGHTGNRTVTHAAKRGTSTITGGTWSLPVINLGAGSATINNSTGTVTLSGIVQSGAYAVRYTHTDGIATDQAVNVSYVPTPSGGGAASAKTARATSSAGTANNSLWQDILILVMNDCPAGRVNFGAYGFNSLSRLDPATGTGTADFEARLTLDGVTLESVPSQNVVSGGVMAFSEFDGLFQNTHPITAGNRTFRIQMRRTSGTGTILTTSTVLEPTIIAT